MAPVLVALMTVCGQYSTGGCAFAGSGEAGNKTKPDGVLADAEDSLRDVAPALNGRASLARVRPCRTGAASFMVARARGRARRKA